MAVVQRRDVQRPSRRRRRPASASASTSSRTSSSYENTPEDQLLSSNIRAIELHLQRLHEECMYLEAAKVQEELQKLKAQRHVQNTTYWVQRHDKTIAGLRQQREHLFSDAQQRMDLQLRQAQEELEDNKRSMTERHVTESKRLKNTLEINEQDRNRTDRPGSPSQKFSGKVLALLEKEKRLARSRFYERAAKARKDAELLMAIENEDRKLNDYRMRQGKLSRLVITHQEERLALQANFEHERRKMVANCRIDQKRITVRVRKTRSDLSRARSLRVAMGTSSSPVLSIAAEKASMKGEQSAATLPLTASPLRSGSSGSSGASSPSTRPRSALPLSRSSKSSKSSSSRRPQSANSSGSRNNRRRARPSTAPSKRRGLPSHNHNHAAATAPEAMSLLDENSETVLNDDVEELNPSQTSKMERSENVESAENRSNYNHRNHERIKPERRSRSAAGNERNERSERNGRNGSRSRRRRRPKSAGGRSKKRTTNKKTQFKSVCWWCSESDGHIANSGGVSVPSASNPRKGTGVFCSWECAASHVFKYFPIQDRWISDLLIQDTAGYLVRKSKRLHKRPQGPGIPSIDM